MKFLSNAVWDVLKQELARKDEDLRKAYERIDRLVEALAVKQNIPLIMPQAELPRFKPAPEPLEKIPGWFDNKPLPQIAPSGAKP
jgi:hypothetical protein